MKKWSLALTIALLPGCQGPKYESTETWALTTVPAGAHEIRLDSAPSTHVEVTQDLAINGESGKSFSSIKAIAIGANGNIYVLDEIESHVIIYDSTGKSIGKIGRKGDGPGEFRSASAIAVARDTVFVYGLGRINALSPSGSSLGSIQSPIRGRVTLASAFPGGVLVSYRGYARGTTKSAHQDTIFVQCVDFAARKTCGPKSAIPDAPRYWVDKVAQLPTLLGPQAQVSLAASGMSYVSRGAEYVIDVIDRDGRNSMRLSRAHTRASTAPADFDEFERLFQESAPPLADMDVHKTLSKAFRIVPRATKRPAIGRVVADADGSVIVQILDSVRTPYFGRSPRSQWDWIQGNRVAGTLVLPEGADPMVLNHDRIYAVITDADGEKSIVRFRIHQSVANQAAGAN